MCVASRQKCQIHVQLTAAKYGKTKCKGCLILFCSNKKKKEHPFHNNHFFAALMVTLNANKTFSCEKVQRVEILLQWSQCMYALTHLDTCGDTDLRRH